MDSISLFPVRVREQFALRAREEVIRMASRGGCFVGAALSCVDLLAHLYLSVLRLEGQGASPDRDYLFFSKGHGVPALYAVLAGRGFFPRERLGMHLTLGEGIYWHPSRAVPGVEFHSGSLGHLLAVAIGVAIDIRLRGGANRVFVILGDGELDEGSIWEGLLVARAQRLGHLIVVVDRNAMQANLPTEELVPLEPLVAKFQAFGCVVRETDGHDFGALETAFADLPCQEGRPVVVVARTVRGKGVPSMEGRADRWFARLSEREATQVLAELDVVPGSSAET
ncbi:MAG TPA: 1-deoxy-D-xylulose-5-phosphate synthase N-terminal domain-containing protein [Anaeromyxobacteraceae bacterium]|nr:1-deoxy-D-xylulose-5-phosphate synthase N-terminal domain-containing protein [Anaeromyxobacteraceae bacterium]